MYQYLQLRTYLELPAAIPMLFLQSLHGTTAMGSLKGHFRLFNKTWYGPMVLAFGGLGMKEWICMFFSIPSFPASQNTGLHWEPKTGNPKNIVGIRWEYTYQGPYSLFYSYYILGIPCLGFPLKSLYQAPVYSGTLNPEPLNPKPLHLGQITAQKNRALARLLTPVYGAWSRCGPGQI